MAIINSTWYEGLSLSFDNTSLGNGSRGSASIDLATNGYIKVFPQLSVTWGISECNNASIDVLLSQDSGTTKDVEPIYEFDIENVTGSANRMSFEIDKVPYVTIGITNGNHTTSGNATEINVSGIYSALAYISA